MLGVRNRIVKDDLKVFGLSNWKDKVTINWVGENMIEVTWRCWGSWDGSLELGSHFHKKSYFKASKLRKLTKEASIDQKKVSKQRRALGHANINGEEKGGTSK